jgi:AcrR family transcriptional regulator
VSTDAFLSYSCHPCDGKHCADPWLTPANLGAVSRREQILATAAELFAQKGFHGVSIAELGAACGFSGPAIYRHFRSKDAVLAEMLVSISDELLSVGRERVAAAATPEEALRALIDWHVTFALEHKALIVVQDRDWSALPLEAREKVRDTQRKYVEVWVKQLRAIHTDLAPKPARASVHATFGLLNSTPHSAFLPPEEMRGLLAGMAARALGCTPAG